MYKKYLKFLMTSALVAAGLACALENKGLEVAAEQGSHTSAATSGELNSSTTTIPGESATSATLTPDVCDTLDGSDPHSSASEESMDTSDKQSDSQDSASTADESSQEGSTADTTESSQESQSDTSSGESQDSQGSQDSTDTTTTTQDTTSSSKMVGSVRLSFETTPGSGHYTPHNIGAVWVEAPDGRFVRTLKLWAAVRKRHLVSWVKSAKNDTKDAMTSATLDAHVAHDVIWDLRDSAGQPVALGPYRILAEVTEDNSNEASVPDGPILAVDVDLRDEPGPVAVSSVSGYAKVEAVLQEQ